MPLSPVTSLLFDQEYVTLEWPVLEKVMPPPRPPFVLHQECALNESKIIITINQLIYSFIHLFNYLIII